MTQGGGKLLDFEALRNSCRRCSVLELCLPAPLEGADLDRLTGMLCTRTYAPNQHVYNTGDRSGNIYIVRKGALKSWVTSIHGHEQILGFHLAGEIFGLDGIDSFQYQSGVQALEPSELCLLPYGALETIASQVPSLHRQLLRVISREIVIEHEHVMMMSSRPAFERVALFVQVLAQREALRGQRPQLLELPMSRADIASYLALANETVSRMLSKLEKNGLIRNGHRKLEILDAEGLMQITGEDPVSIRLAD